MPDWLNSVTARLVQDLLTSLAAYLAAHGFLETSQTQGFIGAGFFMLMLLINTILHASRAAANQVKGADAVMDGIAATSVQVHK